MEIFWKKIDRKFYGKLAGIFQQKLKFSGLTSLLASVITVVIV